MAWLFSRRSPPRRRRERQLRRDLDLSSLSFSRRTKRQEALHVLSRSLPSLLALVDVPVSRIFDSRPFRNLSFPRRTFRGCAPIDGTYQTVEGIVFGWRPQQSRRNHLPRHARVEHGPASTGSTAMSTQPSVSFHSSIPKFTFDTELNASIATEASSGATSTPMRPSGNSSCTAS